MNTKSRLELTVFGDHDAWCSSCQFSR